MNLAPKIESESPGKPLTDYERTIALTVEAARCAADIKYYATKYVYLQNQNTQKVEKWLPWPYLLDLIDIIQDHNVIYILKASQLGISWLMAIINDWMANFGETSKCLLLSQGQTEAYDLLAKVEFIHKHIPPEIALPIENSNREYISFKGNYSQIRALPSTEKAGHGFQGTIVTRDELARHEHARENFKAVSRAIDSGGKLVELSTANKEDPTNYFQEKTSEFYYHPETTKEVLKSGVELYTNPHKPGICLVFLPWNLRPVRAEGMTLQEWWDSRVVPKYTPLEIEEQYPQRIEDVFKASKTRAYFDYQALEDMGFDVCPPIRQNEIDTQNGIIRIYKLPIKGRRYVVYTDPSDGVEDPFVTGVLDYITGEVVASASGMIKADLVGKIHNTLVKAYNDATNSFEYTGSVGGIFSTVLDMLNTPSQAPRRKPDGKIEEDKRGQWISKEYKEMILGDLAFAITKRQLVCHDREFTQQAKLVTRDDSGKPMTEKKLTFDWVMMMSGLWQLQKYVPKTPYRAYTVDL